MFKQCVKNSLCFKEKEDFKKCAQEHINAECIPHRIDYFRCKRYTIDRSKDFRRDPRHGIWFYLYIINITYNKTHF